MENHFALFYEEQGEGTPIIFIHGNGGSHQDFIHQIEYFSHTHHVYALDSRGHGQSPMGKAPFTIDQFAEDLYQFVLEHQIAKAFFVGFSDGGNVVLSFAKRHPECCKGIVANGANVRPFGVLFSVQLGFYKRYYKLKWKKIRTEKEDYELSLLDLMAHHFTTKWSDLRKMNMPALVLVGTKDLIRQSHSKKIARCIPNAKFQMIEGSHFICMESYQLYNQALEEFINSIEGC